MSLIRHLKSACAKDLRQDAVCVLKEQGSQEGWSRVNEGRAEADKKGQGRVCKRKRIFIIIMYLPGRLMMVKPKGLIT